MITVGILTISDSAAAGTRQDLSGPALRKACEELGWEVVAAEIVADDESVIAARLSSWADKGMAGLLLTTGGTGVAARDITPEATRAVLERELPGMGELMRAKGLEQTPLSVLSRGLAGTRRRSLIVNLPGSPRGAEHSLRAIGHIVPHVLELLAGNTEHPNETLRP